MKRQMKETVKNLLEEFSAKGMSLIVNVFSSLANFSCNGDIELVQDSEDMLMINTAESSMSINFTDNMTIEEYDTEYSKAILLKDTYSSIEISGV